MKLAEQTATGLAQAALRQIERLTRQQAQLEARIEQLKGTLGAGEL